MNKIVYILVLLAAALSSQAAQHTLGGDTVVNATNGVASALTQAAAKLFQTTYTSTNPAISFSQSAYWSNNAAALRFNFTDLPVTATEDRCVITLVGPIGTAFTNVVDSITWLGPWGVLNAQTNTITVKWTGGALVAWQDPMHGVATIAQWVANTDNFDAGVNDEVRVSTDAARNLTGVVGRPGGQQLTIENTGSFVITLKNSATSTATNQFLFAQDIALGANQNITLIYDSTSLRWHPIALATVTEPNLLFTDVTTANATTLQHGLMPKADGVSGHFYDSSGGQSAPAGGSTGTLYDVSALGITNSSSETVIYTNSAAITAGQLSSNKGCIVTIDGDLLNNSAATTVTLTAQIYVGGSGTGLLTTFNTSAAITAASALRMGVQYRFELANLTATSQILRAFERVGARGSTTPNSGAFNVADIVNIGPMTFFPAIDTTTNLALGVTLKFNNADPAITFRKYRATVVFP